MGAVTSTTIAPGPFCGDGEEDPGEQCDEADDNGVGFCSASCKSTCADVDCSGGTTANDALQTLRFAVGLPVVLTCSPECAEHSDDSTPRRIPAEACADLDCNGAVTAGDALTALRRAVLLNPAIVCGFECYGSVCGDGELCDEGWNCISGVDGGAEQCDDGNAVDDDGCTNDCEIEISPCNGFLDDPSPEPAPRDVTADAGGDREALRGNSVPLQATIDGPDEVPLELCWTIESKPEGSQAALDDRSSSTPSFIADEPGDYVLVLRAAGGEVISHPSRITVSARTVRTLVDADQGEVLISADHALAMEIPAGALSADTEISIEVRREEDLPQELADADPSVVYEFGPDGTEFSESVELSWISELDPENAPIVVVAVDEEEYSDADEAITTLSADEGVGVQWQTDHFSGAALMRLSNISLNVDGPIRVGVGQRFEFSYSAAAATGKAGLSIMTRKEGIFEEAPQILGPPPAAPVVDGLRYEADVAVLLPETPESKGVIGGNCVGPGVVRVGFELQMSTGFVGQFLVTANLLRQPIIQLSALVRCVDNSAPPVAVNDSILIGFGTSTIDISPLANDFDPDGQLDPTSIEITQGPALGTAVPNADGTVTVTLGGALRLVDSFRYRVSDLGGMLSNEARVNLRRFATPNLVPTLFPDNFTITSGVPQDLAVLANDSDPDGVLDPASVQVSSASAHGTTAVNADGTINYDPDPAYTGADSFEYQAADNRGAVGVAVRVDLSVESFTPAPVTNTDTVNTLQDVAVDIDVLANDTGSINPGSLEVRSLPSFGTALVVQVGTDPPVIRFTPEAGFIGLMTFSYRVSNPDGLPSGSAQVRVFVTDPNNLPPIARDDSERTPKNVGVDIFIAFNDEDPDGFLTLGTEEVVVPPLNGTAARNGFGVIRYEPATDFVGNDSFTYRIADDQNAYSNEATVSVEVILPPNVDPTADDDRFVVSPDEETLLPVLLNDEDTDGTLDVTSVVVTQDPTNGTAIPQADGRVAYTPTPGFIGDDTFRYTVGDDRAGTSNAALVDVLVRDFAGVDGNPVDNISAAQIHFFSHFGSTFVDQGIGSFLGFNHADADALDTLIPISDYTWWFEDNPDTGDPSSANSFSMTTNLQSGVATYDGNAKIHTFTGFVGGPLFPDSGGTLTVEPVGGGAISVVDAPPTLLDSQGDPFIFRGPFDRFQTEVQFPDGEFTHLLLRAIEFRPSTGLRGVLMRVPAEAMALDTQTGMRHRPILDPLASATIEAMGFEPTSGIAVVFYNQEDNSAYFTGPGERTVPLAAGRGVSLPAAQMAAPRSPCENRPTGVECASGPREVLMAVNQNGSVTMHSPEDGAFLGDFLGGGAPNFSISSGWHLVQDPSTNCLLFSDSDNNKVAKYDTDASLIASTFITAAGGISNTFSPRGLHFRDGELLVADNPQGRILRFDSAGAFLGELATGLGRPNGIFTEANGDVLFSDESGSSTTDAVRLIPVDGSGLRDVIGSGLSTPYQISQLLDGNFVVANFGFNQIRVFAEGASTIANVLIGQRPPMEGNMNPRGVWPLRDGNWLATLSNGGGVAVVDPDQPTGAYVSTIELGSTYRFISSVCLPE